MSSTRGAILTPARLDVVVCAHARDAGYLLPLVLRHYARNFGPKGNLVIVTNDCGVMSRLLEEEDVDGTVVDENDILSTAERRLSGWHKQLVLKLRSDAVVQTDPFCTLDADTVILRPITVADLLSDGEPILYFNRDPYTHSHHRYELVRVRALAEVLGIEPVRCLELAEFVITLFCYRTRHLQGLRERLVELYGAEPFAELLGGIEDTPQNRQLAGEWTLYALYLLDYLHLQIPVKNSRSAYLREIHRQKDLESDPFDAKVVHFVDKAFDVAAIEARLESLGLSAGSDHR